MRFLTRITLFAACLILLSGVATAAVTGGTISGTVWYDQNCNGKLDTGEPGLGNVEVQLYKNVSSVWQQQSNIFTDSNGFYKFEIPASGQYKVRFIAPVGYYFSPMGSDSSAYNDSENYGFTKPVCIKCTDVVRNAGLCKKVCKEPLTQGYWKNHPEAWINDPATSINPFKLKIGSKTYNGTEELIGVLDQPVKGDARIILAHQLIAARLNVENGACPKTVSLSDLIDIINKAETWLAGQNSKVSPSASPEAVAWAETLDKFNNGNY